MSDSEEGQAPQAKRAARQSRAEPVGGIDAGGAPDVLLPPALIECVRARLDGRPLAVFLDFDGTLSPIVEHPSLAVLDEDTKEVLAGLATKCRVAIVTGRELADIQARVGLESLYYAGSHGFDIAGPACRFRHPEAEALLPVFDRVEQEIRQKTASIPGVFVERKRFGVTVHFRKTPEEEHARVARVVQEVLSTAPALRVGTGKKVLEFAPDLPWNKGRAVEWLLEALSGGRDPVPVYIGDDVTDEDAFEVLRGRGLTVHIGALDVETSAELRVTSVPQVHAILCLLNEILGISGHV